MTPAPPRPAAPTHRGVVWASHVWFDRALLGDAEARRRVLAAWVPGAACRRLSEGWLVVLPAPRRFDTRVAPGTVFQQVSGRSASAPWTRLPPEAPAGLLLHRSGGWCGGPLESLPVEEPAAWLADAVALPVLATAPLGAPPPVRLALAPVTLDLRSRLGFGEAAGQALAAALAGMSLPAPREGLGWTTGLRGALAGMLGGAARAGAALAGASPTARSLLSRLESLASQLGLESALTAAVGAHNARYLQELLGRLEGGEWLEAIARALPLGGDGASEGGGLAWLSALKGLSWRGPGGPGTAVGAGPDLYARLVALYERAFHALDGQGRVREAAYVLAELLGRVGDAVDYLERKEEYALAAELAESKRLDPGLCVVLWTKAGNEDRAMALAVLHAAFAVAVEQFERRGDHDRAAALRWTWARREYDAGRFVAAVDLAWKVPAAREVALRWLGQAVAAGGVGGARALARSLVARPGARETDLAHLADTLERDTPLARRALAEALATDDDFSRKALRATARALLRDARDAPAPGGAQAARRAAERCGDGALAADLPPLPPEPVASWPAGARRFPVAAADCGLVPLHDAVPLTRGRWLVAVGEAGAWLVGPDGRRQATFAAPTHRLVTTPDAARIVLLGRRADRWRLHRLALPERRLERWTDASFTTVADETDGSVWFVAQGDRVVALDLLDPGLRSLWSVDRLSKVGPLGGRGGDVLALTVATGTLTILVPSAGHEVERFTYALPSLALRERRGFPHPAGASAWAVGAAGVAVATATHVERLGASTARTERRGAVEVGLEADGVTVVASDHAAWLEPSGLVLAPRLEVETTGATRTRARVVTSPDGERWWVVVDDRGRLRAVDLATGALRTDLRLG